MSRALMGISLFVALCVASGASASAQDALPSCQCSETAGEALYTPVPDAKVEGPDADGKCYQLHYKQSCVEPTEDDPPMCTPDRRYTYIGTRLRVMTLNGMWEALDKRATVKREVACPKPAKAVSPKQTQQQ